MITITSRRGRRSAAATLCLSLVLGLAACGGGSDSTTSGASAGPDAAGLAEAVKTVDAYRAEPTWQGPDAPVSIAGLAGRRVVYISVSNSIPVLKYWSDTLTTLVEQFAGVKLEVVDAKGSVDEANKGFQQAIATKADAVVIQALPASLFKAQIATARAAGIKVITANSGVPGKIDGGQDAEVSFDYVKVGQLIGDWMVADSKGTGRGLVVSSDDVPASQPQAQATESEVKRLCPACDIKITDVQIPQWEASIPTLFTTTINSDPDRTYLLPLYDGQALGGLGALRTAGAGERVTVGAFNATPGIVEQLKDAKSGLKLDIGGQNEWWAYAAADTVFRQLAGVPAIDNYHVGLRIFDTSNADLIKGTDQFTWYGGTDYAARFQALWTK